MKLNHMDSDIDSSVREKKALPYSGEEQRTYDGKEDIDRILATMAQYVREKVTKEKEID